MTDNNKKPPQAAEQDYSLRCLTCRHWEGDRDVQWAVIRQCGHKCMSRKDGWPECGDCDSRYQFLQVEINGDATADVAFDANFGCVYWESRDD